jgi:hypothetical protein
MDAPPTQNGLSNLAVLNVLFVVEIDEKLSTRFDIHSSAHSFIAPRVYMADVKSRLNGTFCVLAEFTTMLASRGANVALGLECVLIFVLRHSNCTCLAHKIWALC